MKKTTVLHLTWCILLQLISCVQGKYEVCRLYVLDSTCKYRINAISLSSIRIHINQCTDPVSVTFTITNESPSVRFEHTFDSADSFVSVPGFSRETKLQVKLTDKGDNVINVEADFLVYGQAKVDFVNDDLEIWVADIPCKGLNAAAKISVGVMGTLAFFAGVLVVILIYIKYQRNLNNYRAGNHCSSNLVESGSHYVSHPVMDHRTDGFHFDGRNSNQRPGSSNFIGHHSDQRTDNYGFDERHEDRITDVRRNLHGRRHLLDDINQGPSPMVSDTSAHGRNFLDPSNADRVIQNHTNHDSSNRHQNST